jgi:hypothetical protein
MKLEMEGYITLYALEGFALEVNHCVDNVQENSGISYLTNL